jgi:hypothetical protein
MADLWNTKGATGGGLSTQKEIFTDCTAGQRESLTIFQENRKMMRDPCVAPATQLKFAELKMLIK